MFRVTVHRPGCEPQSEVLRLRSFVIGRNTDHTNTCDISIDSRFVSKRQTRVSRGLLIEPLGATNRTFVEGRAIERPTLSPDGQIRIGSGNESIRVEIVDLANDEGLDGTSTRVAPTASSSAADRKRIDELTAALEIERQKLRDAQRDLANERAEVVRLRGARNERSEAP